MVSTPLYPTRMSIVAGNAVVASHDRVAERGQVRYDWQHYIPLVEHKPGERCAMAPRWGLMRHTGGDRVMAKVLERAHGGLQSVIC